MLPRKLRSGKVSLSAARLTGSPVWHLNQPVLTPLCVQIVHLDNILNIFLAYPTNVKITVVTDAPASVDRMLQGLGTMGVDVWRQYNASAHDGRKYNLLYEHRHVMRVAAKDGKVSWGWWWTLIQQWCLLNHISR